MALRGYIKPVDGHMRMRFVQPGYDVDTAPSNKVIFDSDDIGTLSVFATGVYRFNDTNGSAVSRQIATWDLDFIPLCTFQFRYSSFTPTFWRPYFSASTVNISRQTIIVDKTGITARLDVSNAWVDVAWQAYRLAVTP